VTVAETEDVTTEEEEQRDPEQEARRRLALAQIRQYPDPVLRMKAREVEAFDDELVRLAQRMGRLMHEALGVGLAATQVGILRRVFVFQRQPEDEEAEPETLAVVNPAIVERGEETEVDDEGCLSLQGVHVPVERSTAVVLEGADEHGRPVRYELADLSARVVQHELDHLDGTLILDRTTDEARREALGTLRPRLG
jgi:peptide deformylase